VAFIYFSLSPKKISCQEISLYVRYLIMRLSFLLLNNQLGLILQALSSSLQSSRCSILDSIPASKPFQSRITYSLSCFNRKWRFLRYFTAISRSGEIIRLHKIRNVAGIDPSFRMGFFLFAHARPLIITIGCTKYIIFCFCQI
jgi:hypothetical protein